jgi:hypothetical protein
MSQRTRFDAAMQRANRSVLTVVERVCIANVLLSRRPKRARMRITSAFDT